MNEFPEKKIRSVAESKESPSFNLEIIVHRHGPKSSIAGDLSEEGRELSERLFRFLTDEKNLDKKQNGPKKVSIEYSPIGRAAETANIFAKVQLEKQVEGRTIESLSPDGRLSEGRIAEHPKLIEQYGGMNGRWIEGWMRATERPSPDVKTGTEAAADFAGWLLEKIRKRAGLGGEEEIQAFSHAPVMVAFLLKIEEEMKRKIAPENMGIFIGSYLSFMSFHVDSSRPEEISLSFGSKKIQVPIGIIREISKKQSR